MLAYAQFAKLIVHLNMAKLLGSVQQAGLSNIPMKGAKIIKYSRDHSKLLTISEVHAKSFSNLLSAFSVKNYMMGLSVS